MDHYRSCTFFLAVVWVCMQIWGCGGGATSIPLMVTTTSLPNGTVNIRYSALVLATGGAPPYTWFLFGTTPMPPGVTWDTSGDISGTPTTAGYFGPYGFTLTDSNGTTVSSIPLYINIAAASSAAAHNSAASCAPLGNEAGLKAANPYAFMVKGTDGNGNPIVIAGSFTPDGAGRLTSAAVDYNGFTSGPEQLQVNLAASSYAFGTSAQGCLYLSFSGVEASAGSVNLAGITSNFKPANVTRARKIKIPASVASTISGAQFRFSLSEFDGAVYHTGRIVESADAISSGTNASGLIQMQTPSAFTLAALQPNYAFGVNGWTATPKGILRTVLAGTFANDSGVLSVGYADLNAGGAASGELSGGYGNLNSNVDSSTGRGTGSYFLPTPVGNLSFDFAFYVVNRSDFILLSTDPPVSGSTTLLLSGRALASSATYESGPLNGYYLIASHGLEVSGSSVGNVVDIGTMNATRNGAIPIATIYSNHGGIYATNRYANISYTLESDSGRVCLAGLTAAPPVIYLTGGGISDNGIAGFLVERIRKQVREWSLVKRAVHPNSLWPMFPEIMQRAQQRTWTG